MKLALGTVQFGLNYGITNAVGQTPAEEVVRILNWARKKGIDLLDTASVYGTSEEVLGNAGVSGWDVVTKIPSCPDKAENGRDWVVSHVRRSLGILRVDRLYGILLHDASDLLSAQGKKLAMGLQEVKKEGLVQKIGYSIYSPKTLIDLMNVMSPDLIQAPLNALDQRLIEDGHLPRLIHSGVEVHVRSVFLQGLLLESRKNRPSRFDQWKDVWNRWDEVVEKQGGSYLSACLGFIKQYPEISRVVVGVESLSHLEQLVKTWETASPIDGDSLSCADPMLIDPFNWKKVS